MYKQSIILFGIVLPLLFIAAVVGAAVYFRGNVAQSFAERTDQYNTKERNRIGAVQLETQIIRQRADMAEWQKTLGKPTFSLVTTNIREIAETLPPKEFQQTFLEELPQAVGFGGVSAQKSSGIKLSFRGTFRTVQRALLELETRMPNLQLQELSISPVANPDSSLLTFDMTYSAWEN